MARVARTAATPLASSSAKSNFRPDIQGLRAVAVGLVALNHAGVGFVSGGYIGVDVFFVISGFLITGLMLNEAEETHHVSFANFYARRARRILPMATVVIIATVVASVVYMNFLRARTVIVDQIWTTLFAANVHFARIGTDYFASDGPVSPLQHFWSLAVEEQFYVVWPAVLSLTLFGRSAFRRGEPHPRTRRRRLLRGRVVLLLIVVGAWSLYTCIQDTRSSPVSAYFSTVGRLWELIAGALLATLLPGLRRIPSSVGAFTSWLGIAGIGFSAVVFNDQTAFPGTAALIPVLATCCVLIGGIHQPPRGAGIWLATKPMCFLGDISFSLYLWHWPILVLAAANAGHPLGVWSNLALLLGIVAMSACTYYGIENPIRHATAFFDHPRWRSFVILPVAVSLTLVLGVVIRPSTPTPAQATMPRQRNTDVLDEVRVAVAAGRANAPIPQVIDPAIERVAGDRLDLGSCSGLRKTKNTLCQMGDPKGKKLIVVFGNSHATMWIPAVQKIALTHQLRFIPIVKESCVYDSYVSPSSKKDCLDWFRWAEPKLAALHPDIVIVPAYVEARWKIGIPDLLERFSSVAPRVVLMSDAPGIDILPTDCLLLDGATQGTCLRPQRKRFRESEVILRRMASQHNAEFIDVHEWFCYQDRCPLVVNSTVVYRDTGHITATYSRFLTPALARALRFDAAN